MNAPHIAAGGRRRWLAALVILAMLQGAAAGVAAFSTRGLFESMHGAGSVPRALLLALAGAGFSVAVLRIVFRRTGELLAQDYVRATRLVLFDHASRMWPRDLAARRTGHLNLRFVGDMTALKGWPARGIPRLVEGVLFLPIMLAVLFVLAPDFGWIASSVVAASLVCIALMAPALGAAHSRVRRLRGRLAADLAERMPLASDLAAFGRRPTETGLINERSRSLSQSAVSLVTYAETLRALPDALMGAAAAMIIWRGAAAGLPTGTIAAGLAALGLIARPLRDLMGIANTFAAYQTALRKLEAALAKPVAPVQSKDGVKLSSAPISLELKSLKLADAETADVVLAAGGKGVIEVDGNVASVLRALAGKEQILEGDVTLSGAAISALTPGSLRRGVAVITDGPVILQGSLRRAITLGLSERPDDNAILAALERQKLQTLLTGLGGLDRHLKEGARMLRREDRIAISVLRAALSNPGLVLAGPDVEPAGPVLEEWLKNTPATVARVRVAAAADIPDNAAGRDGSGEGGFLKSGGTEMAR
jgi:ATP-binding cassette, subfamily B, bacterial